MTLTNSPVTARFDPKHRELLDNLAASSSVSEVLREGVVAVAAARARPQMPLHARMVDDPDIDSAVEEAVSAACRVLDEIFPGRRETEGIGSNFQGVLCEHVRAMLMGRDAAPRRGYSRHITALVGDEDSFGVLPTGKLEGQHGFTLCRKAEKVGEPDQYFDSERGFVALERLQLGNLYTSTGAAARGFFAWLKRTERSPREADFKLCAIGWAGDEPLRLLTLAR